MRRTHTAIIAVAMTIAAAISGQPSAGAADSAPTTVTTPPRIVDADHPVSRVGDKVPIESLQRLKARPAKTPTLPTLTEHGQVTAKRTGATYERNLDHYKDGVPSGRMDVAYDPVNDCRAFLDSKVGKKVVDRFRYCSVSRWTYNHVEVATGRVLGTATYLQTTAGQAPQDRREIYYMVNLGFFDIQGTVPKTGPLEVSGISSGYRGADGSNVACEVTNSATNPQMLGQWLANGNAVATIVFDQNKSLGYGRDFVSRCGVATSTCVGKYCGEFTDADTSIRFDSASYLEGASGGVFDAAVPKILYDPRSAAHGAVATHIMTAYAYPELTHPKVAGKSIPGWGDRPLTRLYEGWDGTAKLQRQKNIVAKDRACARIKPANSTGLDCDEFPFGSTYEGPAYGMHFSVKYLDLSQNRSAGGSLASFYSKERILHRDAFNVMILWNPADGPPPGWPGAWPPPGWPGA